MKRTVPALLAALLLAGCASRGETFSSGGTVGRPDVPPASSVQEAAQGEESPQPPPESSRESEPEKEPESRPALAMSADFLALSALSNEGVTWGPGTQQTAAGRSAACEALQEQFGGEHNVWFIGPEEENTVTLTFDQGYENGYTASILDTLKEKDVQAVFFLTGHYVRTEPELVQRMIDEGHILGNHSDSHKVYCRELTPEESLEDALYMQQKLRDDYGYEMRLFRFPEGEFSEQSLALMDELGYASVFWSFAYADWNVNDQPEPQAAKERIFRYLHPGEIMLLHSVSSTNAAILGDVIDEIRARGYTVGPFEALR